MITAESIISKFVGLIVGKSVGKLVELPFDKKKKACRSLTKLYYCIQALDEITERLFNDIEFHAKYEKESFAFGVALNSQLYHVEHVTKTFIELGTELRAGLEIIDPALAQCCNALYVFKGDFLLFMEDSLRWDRTKEPARLIIMRPKGAMEATNIDEMYVVTKKAFDQGEVDFWPKSALDDFESDFEDVTVNFEDAATARDLIAMLKRQNELLKLAKEMLRRLLKDSFSIEEILFQSSSRPYM